MLARSDRSVLPLPTLLSPAVVSELAREVAQEIPFLLSLRNVVHWLPVNQEGKLKEMPQHKP